MLKLIDSTSYFGRAEKEIQFSADFERYVKRGFDIEAIKKVDIIKIQETYNLKGFTFGNFVTQEERYFFLYVLSKQLEALAKISNNKNIGNGELIIGFGADGQPGSAAHFQPARNFINLNRGRKSDYRAILQGQQSFTHEYLHYLDYKQGRGDKTIAHNAASETIRDDKPASNLKTRLFSEFIRELYFNEDFKKGVRKQKPWTMDYWFSPIELAARSFEAAVQIYVHEHLPEYKKYFIIMYELPLYPSKKMLKDYGMIDMAVEILRVESEIKAQEPAPQEPAKKTVKKPAVKQAIKTPEIEPLPGLVSFLMDEKKAGIKTIDLDDFLKNKGIDFNNLDSKTLDKIIASVLDIQPSKVAKMGVMYSNKNGKNVTTKTPWRYKTQATTSVKLLDFQSISSRDIYKLKLNGVYFDKNNIVSTDATAMVVAKNPFNKEETENQIIASIKSKLPSSQQSEQKDLLKSGLNGKIFSFKEGRFLDERFPLYLEVIPNIKESIKKEIDLLDFHSFASAVDKFRIMFEVGSIPIYIKIKIGDQHVLLNPQFVVKTIKLLLKLGHKKATIGIDKKEAYKRAVTFSSTFTDLGLVMPVTVKEDESVFILEYV